MLGHFCQLYSIVLCVCIVKGAVQYLLVDNSIFKPYNEGMVNHELMAFGDFNADSYTDIVVLERELVSRVEHITIYLWDNDNHRFRTHPILAMELGKEGRLVNVIPSDYNYDGRLDLLLVFGVSNQFKTHVYLGNTTHLDQGNPAFSSLAQPFLIDYFGLLKSDLFGISENGISTIFCHNITKLGGVEFSILERAQFCSLAKPHSSSFVDLDGDCLADIFLVCNDENNSNRIYQIWLNTKSSGFVLHSSGRLPNGIGPITFGDMDGDGSIDMVYPRCDSSGCYLEIAFNNQIGLCNESRNENCRYVSNLCVSDKSFTITFDSSHPNHMSVPIKDFGLEALVLQDEDENPVPIQIGDFTLDGYLDLAVIVGNSKGETTAVVLESIKPVSTKARIGFKIEDTISRTLNMFKNTKRVAFIDLDENGSLDLAITLTTKSAAEQSIVFAMNKITHDSFFLKILVTNGACPGFCNDNSSRWRPSGANLFGAIYKFSVLDVSGAKRIISGAQYAQSAYRPLLMPYVLHGLGSRANNFIEELYIGVSYRQAEHFKEWSGIIPNSQLVMMPYQPDNSIGISTWVLELFINPSKYANWVLVFVVVVMLILSAVVLLLQQLENRADEREKKQASHDINFDAF